MSIAYYLCKKGATNVTVLEKKFPASGPTGRSSATINPHIVWGFGHETELNMTQLSDRSYRVFSNFDEAIGGSCGFTKTGMMISGHKEHESMIREMASVNRYSRIR